MDLRYHLPRTDLSGYIRCYYYFATETPAAQPMCAELGNVRVVIAGGGAVRPPGGEAMAVSTAHLIGPTTGAYLVEAQAGTRVFGAGILPRGWGALLGISAEEVSDSVVDLAAFMGPASAGAMERIRAAPDLARMAAIADRYFAGLLERRARRGLAYPTALERWLVHPGDLGLDDLIDMMDLSRRQTDRLAKQFFGASPKLLQRKYRVLRAADRLRETGGSWSEAAGESFYDQSHFIKEFRTFVGVTPFAFVHNEARFAAAVLAKRRRAMPGHPLAGL